MTRLESEKAFLKGVKLKLGHGSAVGIVEMAARLTPKIAEQLGCRYVTYDNRDLPKEFKVVELETEVRDVLVKLAVSGVARYNLQFRSSVLNKFKIIRVGGKKKAKSTFLGLRFNAQVAAGEADVIWDYAKTAGMAEGVLTIEAQPEPVQQPLTAEASEVTAGKVVEMMARADQAIHSEVERLAAEASRIGLHTAVLTTEAQEPDPVQSYLPRMLQAKTAEEGRAIWHAFECAIDEMRGGTSDDLFWGPSSCRLHFIDIPAKDWRRTLKALKANDKKRAELLTDLIDEGRAMETPWRKLLAAEEAQQSADEPTDELVDDTVAEAVSA